MPPDRSTRTTRDRRRGAARRHEQRHSCALDDVRALGEVQARRLARENAITGRTREHQGTRDARGTCLLHGQIVHVHAERYIEGRSEWPAVNGAVIGVAGTRHLDQADLRGRGVERRRHDAAGGLEHARRGRRRLSGLDRHDPPPGNHDRGFPHRRIGRVCPDVGACDGDRLGVGARGQEQ